MLQSSFWDLPTPFLAGLCGSRIALHWTGGTVDIPVSLDGGNIIIHKYFTFQIAFTGATGAAGSSAQWYSGTKITGTSTTATIFSDSGITAAKVGDMYLNTDTMNTYRCTIDRITPHCVVGQCTAEGLGDWFAKSSTQASSNYGIDRDGRVGLYVEEKNRSWCSSSNANDQRAITIECASDTSEPYAFRDVVYQTLIKLCVDICKRNGKKKLIWFGDKDKTLS